MPDKNSRNVTDPLAQLNQAQRAAVTFGIDQHPAAAGSDHPPLLVIAGAGSGKTSTLAHRVAQIVSQGTDPGRILLLTFSRRAASEMTRRVERILSRRTRASSLPTAAALAWSGTFHSVGARLLREYAGRIGLDPAFTIHDRQDSADLMNLVRHGLGLSAKSRRFPLKTTCLSIYSAVLNTQATLVEVLQSRFPWCSEWDADLKRLFLEYVETKQAQRGARLRRPAALLGADGRRTRARPGNR
jgi:DNA helicase-2/ATP-dependent DNA helicase PcrA